MDEMASGCCARRLTIDLPDCPPTSRCLQIPEASAECVPGAAPGTFQLKLYVRKDHNLPRTVHLVAPAPMKISPQPHELGGVSGLFGPITYLVEGASGDSFPRRACFWVNLSPPAQQQAPYDLDGACCSEYVCVQVPYCGLPTPTPNPNPLSLDGPTRRAGDGS
jgi:hypothetical protein